MKQFRRSGGADSFKVNSSTVICEFHFKISDIKVSSGYGKKTLVTGAILSLFKFKEKRIKERKAPLDRRNTTFSVSDFSTEEGSGPEVGGGFRPLNMCLFAKCAQNIKMKFEKLKEENKKLRKELNIFEEENILVNDELKELKENNIYSYKTISSNPTLFLKATGLEVQAFQDLFSFLKPGENCNNIKFYEADRQLAADKVATNQSEKKRGPKPKLDPQDQLFMCLAWLRNGFSLAHLSWLFHLPKSTLSRYLISWINFLYFSLGNIPHLAY